MKNDIGKYNIKIALKIRKILLPMEMAPVMSLAMRNEGV